MLRRKEQWTCLSKLLLRCRAIHSKSPSAPFLNSTLFFPTAKSPNSPHFHAKRFASQSSQHNCWNCNAHSQQLLFLLCDSFSFGLSNNELDVNREKNYELDVNKENLHGKYKDWQKKLHPDLVHSNSEKEREFAAQQSSRVIDAHRTLKDPILRAIYILKLEGVDVNEEETISEPQLLAEIMEIREAVEEAPDFTALTDIQTLMTEKLQHWSNSFANAFGRQKFEEAIDCFRKAEAALISVGC
ncbi:hypothetical protein M5689_015475 [Euphorbia peplus]|nr:hypothetical protein M5689_015475 [Euphorbia peplus]